MLEIIPIVDSNDKIIKYKERKQINRREDIYRISALWVVNSQKQILLAQRSFTKTHSPGKWGPAVAGTVAKEETYLENILKETEEEIGIDLEDYNFQQVEKIFTDADWKFFCQWYFAKVDLLLEKFIFPKDEVEQLKWMDRKEFEKDLKNHPEKYTTNMSQHYKVLKKYF